MGGSFSDFLSFVSFIATGIIGFLYAAFAIIRIASSFMGAEIPIFITIISQFGLYIVLFGFFMLGKKHSANLLKVMSVVGIVCLMLLTVISIIFLPFIKKISEQSQVNAFPILVSFIIFYVFFILFCIIFAISLFEIGDKVKLSSKVARNIIILSLLPAFLFVPIINIIAVWTFVIFYVITWGEIATLFFQEPWS
jgi:hypothetical protein